MMQSKPCVCKTTMLAVASALVIHGVMNVRGGESPDRLSSYKSFETKRELNFVVLDDLRMPKVNEVEEMQVECFVPGVREVPRFIVPQQQYRSILDAFGEADLLTEHVTIGHTEYGCLRVKFKGATRRVIHIPWYWTGKGPLVYSLYGVQCSRKPSPEKDIVGSEAVQLCMKVQRIFEQLSHQDGGAK